MRNSLIVASLSIFVASASPVIACYAPQMPRGADETINPRKPNMTVFGKSVTAWTNYYRCKSGVAELTYSSKLDKASFAQSKSMAAKGRLTHDINQDGAADVAKNLKRARAKFTRFGENISFDFYYQWPKVTFRIVDAASCDFEYKESGKKIPPHSYATLAERVVGDWYASKQHRVNVLNPKFKKHGAAMRFVTTEKYPCGALYLTQVFTN